MPIRWTHASPVLAALLLLFAGAPIVSQDEGGKKTTPTTTATIDPREQARREQAAPANPDEPKKVPNQGTIGAIPDMAVPPGAIGETFNASQGGGMKVKPSKTAKIDIKEIERREKADPEAADQEKKIPNEESKIPMDLPVPPNAIGPTFQVPPQPAPADTPRTPPGPRKKDASELEPNFPALGDNNTSIPPDLGGAVGPNHVMTALNTQVRIQNRTGGTISTVTLNGFFAPLTGGTNVFDPKVTYDPFAGRWVITAPTNAQTAASSLLIAVSATDDPTGTWTGYAFDTDAADTRWFDYPSLGFNKNWVVVTGNLYANVGNAFQGAQIYIFDKPALYAGAATPSVLNRPTSEGGVISPAVTLDNTLNTEYMLSNWNGNSGGNGYLRIYTITGTPAAPTYAITMLLPSVSSPWASFPNATGADFAPQATVAQRIQNNDARMHGVIYQNGSLWGAQSAFLPAAAPTRSAVQWWQLDPATATVQQFGRVDDPTGVSFFAFPSIAVNKYNDALLGYSSFSGSQFASANYSFRLGTDLPSTMQPTVQFRAGLAKYFKDFGSGSNRWGDYSASVVDPDGYSLWTLQEYAETPSGGFDRWGTEWTRVVPPTANLYMQDRTGDAGAEPNPSALPMWESGDIWIRKLQDSPSFPNAHVHENAEFRTGTANPNYVYVKVRNRGGAASAGTEQLTLYWAKASSGLSWTSPWLGGVFFDPGPNTMLMGGIIGTQTLPAIGAGATSIRGFAWNPPDPSVYAGAFGGDQNHFCLLARITNSSTVTGMTFPETPDLHGNVRNNNRIAWKNINVYDMLPGTGAPVPNHVVLANLLDRPMRTKIRFNAVDANGNAALLQGGTLKVTPVGAFKDALRDLRLGGQDIRDNGDGSYTVLRDGTALEGITLAPGQFGTIEVAFVANDAGVKREGYAVVVTQLEQTPQGERVVGGQTMLIGKVKGYNEAAKSPGPDIDGDTDGEDGDTADRWPWWWWLILLAILVLLILLLLRRRR